jgi:hypothetical protein
MAKKTYKTPELIKLKSINNMTLASSKSGTISDGTSGNYHS